MNQYGVNFDIVAEKATRHAENGVAFYKLRRVEIPDRLVGCNVPEVEHGPTYSRTARVTR